jgi:hypothetical protein
VRCPESRCCCCCCCCCWPRGAWREQGAMHTGRGRSKHSITRRSWACLVTAAAAPAAACKAVGGFDSSAGGGSRVALLSNGGGGRGVCCVGVGAAPRQALLSGCCWFCGCCPGLLAVSGVHARCTRRLL